MARRTDRVVVKSNQLIEAAYHLSLAEQRLILLAIANLDSQESLECKKPHIITAADMERVYGLTVRNAYMALTEVTERLYGRSVTIYNPFPDRPEVGKLETRWISSIRYVESQGCVELIVAADIIPFISQIRQRFTSYRLAYVARMSSAYAVRLYELLVQWRDRGDREVELEWLRDRLQLDGRHANIRDFKRWVLVPAVDQINACTDLVVSWSQRKAGRQVVALTFTFDQKKPQRLAQATIETPRPKRITRPYIEKHARPGETWEQAEARLRRQIDVSGPVHQSHFLQDR